MTVAAKDDSRFDGAAKPLIVIEKTNVIFPLLNTTEVWQYRELFLFLMWRDIKLRYRQTILGMAWFFIQPLLMILMFTVTFSKWAKIPSDGGPYPVFILLGILAWNFFSGGTRNAVNSITTSAALISKVYFPRILCPCAAVAATLVDFLVAATLLIPMSMRYQIPWSVSGALVFIGIIFGIGFFSAGIGFWLGPLNARFRDIAQVLPFVFQLWMFGTPIIYPMKIVPENYRWLVELNPMVGYIEGIRSAIMNNPIDTRSLGWSIGATLIVFVTGLLFFQKNESDLADYLG